MSYTLFGKAVDRAFRKTNVDLPVEEIFSCAKIAFAAAGDAWRATSCNFASATTILLLKGEEEAKLFLLEASPPSFLLLESSDASFL